MKNDVGEASAAGCGKEAAMAELWIAGLGPAGLEKVTPETRQAISGAD
jgi:hypothetical protein